MISELKNLTSFSKRALARSIAMAEHEKIMCPSSKAQSGAQLIGVRQDDGTVAILPQPLRIDEAFIKTANEISPAKQRFRFTNKCIEAGCSQWTGSRCGVADKIVSAIDDLTTRAELPPCGIRPKCRWFKQNDADAWRVCPYVITETTSEEWEVRFQYNQVTDLNKIIQG